MEKWVSIKNYEGKYEISTMGNISSLDRISSCGRNLKGQVIKKTIDSRGYEFVILCNGKSKHRTVHQLMAESFLNHTPCGYKLVVNHINHDRIDNRLVNLEVVTQRENSNKKHLKSTSKFTGVSFNKISGKWDSSIHVNGKTIKLGRFNSDVEASVVYNKYRETHGL